jgi:3-phenylpropionate/trans-cinnamate dioxygenase ferredoxin reductase component
VPPEHTGLPRLADLGDVDWRLGVAATALDRRAREVVLADGTRLPYDRVLVATGVRNRPWPNAEQAALEGVRGIRTREDSRVIRDHLDAGPKRVLVVGAGFTGSEVASICRQRGLPVTVVERAENPLVGPLGGVVGDVAAGLQRAGGVDLRCNVTVEALEGSGGRFRAASLSDGTTVEAGLAVIALGALRNTEWLADSGLACGPLGVSCDPGGRAYAVNGMAVEDVFAAGDVARFPHALYEYEFLALEHWENAVVGAQVAAHNMICDDPDRRAHVSVPGVWDTNIGDWLVTQPGHGGLSVVAFSDARSGRACLDARLLPDLLFGCAAVARSPPTGRNHRVGLGCGRGEHAGPSIRPCQGHQVSSCGRPSGSAQ